MNLQVFKLDLEKAKELEIKLPTTAGSSKKQESSRKTSISALLTKTKPLTVWITQMLATDKKRKPEIMLFLIKEHIATQSHTHHIIKGTEPESEQTSDPAVNFQEIKMTETC